MSTTQSMGLIFKITGLIFKKGGVINHGADLQKTWGMGLIFQKYGLGIAFRMASFSNEINLKTVYHLPGSSLKFDI